MARFAWFPSFSISSGISRGLDSLRFLRESSEVVASNRMAQVEALLTPDGVTIVVDEDLNSMAVKP